MRFVFLVSLLILLFSVTSYWYQATAHICPTPITYRLGEIDGRFGLAPEVALEAATTAEALWEDALGQDLFVYDEQSDFAINFIYDERQQRAQTEEEWQISLDSKEKYNRDLIEQVKQLGQAYEGLQVDYNEERASYERRLNAYNEEVERYNDEGGAPREAYTMLQVEAKELSHELKELMEFESQLKSKAEEINRLGEEGNEKITAYNAEVLEYNAMFGNIETFTQGDFERERINVYKFTTPEELTAVLTHEFGHALGLGHVEGEGSIMYYLMTERGSSSLSETDKEAYYLTCGTETTLAQKARRFIRELLAEI